jgi:hypothetical protein
MDLFKIKNKAFKGLSALKWYSYIISEKCSKYDAIFGQIWAIVCALLITLGICGCGQIKYVPIKMEEKVIIKDSIVRVIDTVTVEVAKEIVKEVIPQIDTSVLETSVATSIAYVDTLEKKLHHTLEQKGKLKVEIDTCYITKVEEKIIFQDRPIEVEVPKRDNIFWFSIIFNIVILLIAIMRLFK